MSPLVDIERARRRRAAATAALVAALLGAAGSTAQATAIAERTVRISVAADGGDPNAGATRPSINGSGGVVAFDSTATNLTATDANGPVRDVFARDIRRGTTRLLSLAPGGAAADGASRSVVLARAVDLAVFESDATNLVTGDTNGTTDVFLASLQGELLRASVAHNGAQADGPSFTPDVSEDGRYIAFASAATNLVPGDGNGRIDVFVRDVLSNTTRIVSAPRQRTADGDAFAPAISPDGRFVSFTSTTSNLVFDDGNNVSDVFVYDLRTNRLTRATTDPFGDEQSRAVAAPFVQVSDIARGGRSVTFDSDAADLVLRDRNRDTDVFFRQFRPSRTARVSLDAYGIEGTNDSFFPRMTPDGRYVAFQSFAGNLSLDDPAGEDIFVYDRKLGLPTIVNVPARGGRRSAETVAQLLQRPDISDDGETVAFTSTAGNLVDGDNNRAEDVFIRRLQAPRGRIVAPKRIADSSRPRYVFRADDRRATRFICVIDRRVRFPCKRRGRLPRLPAGVHQLVVRAGGPGMHYQEAKPATKLFFVPAPRARRRAR